MREQEDKMGAESQVGYDLAMTPEMSPIEHYREAERMLIYIESSDVDELSGTLLTGFQARMEIARLHLQLARVGFEYLQEEDEEVPASRYVPVPSSYTDDDDRP